MTKYKIIDEEGSPIRLCAPVPLGCGKVVKGFNDDLSIKEYGISGLCQECQDEVFAEPEDEYDEMTVENGYISVVLRGTFDN